MGRLQGLVALTPETSNLKTSRRDWKAQWWYRAFFTIVHRSQLSGLQKGQTFALVGIYICLGISTPPSFFPHSASSSYIASLLVSKHLAFPSKIMASTTASKTASSTTNTSSASASCIKVTPDKNGWVPPESCNAVYMYHPSFLWALVFAIVFGAATVLHISQAFWYKKVDCFIAFDIELDIDVVTRNSAGWLSWHQSGKLHHSVFAHSPQKTSKIQAFIQPHSCLFFYHLYVSCLTFPIPNSFPWSQG